MYSRFRLVYVICEVFFFSEKNNFVNIEQLPSSTRVIKSSDTEEPPGYGSICLKNNDCQHYTVQLECLRGTCVCLEGYVPLGKYLCYDIRGQGREFLRNIF